MDDYVILYLFHVVISLKYECTYIFWAIVVVVLLFYVHGKHLRLCRDGQLT